MAEKKNKKSDSASVTLLDKRVLDRNITRALISRADVETHMKSLPDLTDQADNIADKVYGKET